MKKILIILTVLVQFSLAQCQPGGRKIEIEVKGIPDTVLYLVHYYGNSNSIADTAYKDKSGKYIFAGKTTLPQGVYIVVDQSKSKPYFEFLMDKNQHFKMQTDTVAPFDNLVITNSPVNEDFKAYSNFVRDSRREADALRDQIAKLKEEDAQKNDALIREQETRFREIDSKVKAYQRELADKEKGSMLAVLLNLQWEPEAQNLENATRQDSLNAYYYTKTHYWDKIDFSDERIVRTPIFHEKLKTYLTVLVVQHPDSVIAEGEKIVAQTVSAPELFKFVVWYLGNMTERSNIMGMEKAFVHFAREYYLKGKTWWASEAVLKKMEERVRVLERTLLGAIAPELQMWDTNKVVTSLHRVQANFTVLVFWDYECGHCNKVLPVLRDFYHEVKMEGVQVFAVCTKTDLEKWKKAIQEKQLDWINVNGGYSINRYDTLYDIMATPVIFLLDKDKKILAKKIEVEQLKEILTIEMERRNQEATKPRN